MSTGSSTDSDQPSITITLMRNDDGWWTARDEALASLDDVIDAVENDGGRRPTDEELREAGIDPGANRLAGSGDLPDALE